MSEQLGMPDKLLGFPITWTDKASPTGGIVLGPPVSSQATAIRVLGADGNVIKSGKLHWKTPTEARVEWDDD